VREPPIGIAKTPPGLGALEKLSRPSAGLKSETPPRIQLLRRYGHDEVVQQRAIRKDGARLYQQES